MIPLGGDFEKNGQVEKSPIEVLKDLGKVDLHYRVPIKPLGGHNGGKWPPILEIPTLIDRQKIDPMPTLAFLSQLGALDRTSQRSW